MPAGPPQNRPDAGDRHEALRPSRSALRPTRGLEPILTICNFCFMRANTTFASPAATIVAARAVSPASNIRRSGIGLVTVEGMRRL